MVIRAAEEPEDVPDRGRRTSVVIALVGALATIALSLGAAAQGAAVVAERVEARAAALADHIDDRLASTEELLWASASAMEQGLAGDALAGTLSDPDLLRRHPSHVAVAYARSDGGTLAIEAVGPLDGNDVALGRDLLAEPERRRAAEVARDTGLEAATGPTALHVATEGTGLVVMVPVYDGDMPVSTAPERRRAFDGVVLAALDVELLLEDVQRVFPDVAARLVDVGPVTVVGTGPTPEEQLVWAADGAPTDDGDTQRDLVAGDRRWRLYVQARPGAIPAAPLPWVVLVAGGLLTAAGLIVVRVMGSARARAEQLVAARTAELVAANEGLRETDRLKTQFMTNVSHELRTPLTSVLGFTVTLRRMDLGDAPPALDHFLGRIEANARSLHRMVEELLDFDRFQREGQGGERQPIELAPRIREIAHGLYGDADDRTVLVDAEEGLWVDVEEHALDRIMANLLHNADRYAPGEDPIEVGVGSDGVTATIEVRDRGPGFGGAENLFERFVRGPDAPGGGTGIGLAMVRELARAHGGDATLGDRDGGGGWVRVRIPLCAPPQPADG